MRLLCSRSLARASLLAAIMHSSKVFDWDPALAGLPPARLPLTPVQTITTLYTHASRARMTG